MYDASNKSATSKETCQDVPATKQKQSAYKCKLCDKIYTAERSLVAHMETIHEGIRFNCD